MRRPKWTLAPPTRTASAAVKLRAARLAEEVTVLAAELLGPASLVEHPWLEKTYRDARGFEFMEGTGNVHRRGVFQGLLRDSFLPYREGRLMRVGVDLAPIDAVARLRGRRWFDRFVYAPAELELAEQMGPARRGEFLAGRFAAKEAVLKVLGRGLFQGVRPCDIAVARTQTGAPEVRLCGSALAAARPQGIGPISVSITHRHNLAIAMAVAAELRTRREE